MGSLLSVPTIYLDGNNFQPGNYVPGTFVDPAYLGGLDLFNPTLFNGKSNLQNFFPTTTMQKNRSMQDISVGIRISMISFP
jgi:hypothetical protein